MHGLENFFTHIASWQRTAILVSGLIVFWILEGIIPLMVFRFHKYRHAALNLFFTFTTIVVNFGFAFLIVRSSAFASGHHIGLLYVFPLPLWIFICIGLMLLDFISAWLIHWIQHTIKWMWKFHIIHHADTWVDATTANRHHPGESFFRAVFTLVAVLVSGSPLWLVFLYQSLSVFLSQFNHANIDLPGWLDQTISLVIVSPNMHKVHHHYAQPLTDTNYGNIFSLWDRLFGTFVYIKDVKTLKYGIDIYPREEENNRIKKLLRIPFDAYRPPPGAKFSGGPQHG